MWRLTPEQRELRDQIRDFAREHVRDAMLDVDESGDYPYELHRCMGEQELLGLAIPREHGVEHARERDPIWPDSMPGADGVHSGQAERPAAGAQA